MPFVKVDNPNPIVIPAVAQKNYDKIWITKMLVETPRPEAVGTITVSGFAWDGQNDILFSGPVLTKTVNDIFKLALQDDDVMKAINALLRVVNKYAV